MSKKSRKRNKKILAVLGLAAAATAASRRNKGTAQGASGSDKAKFTSDAAYKTPVAPVASIAPRAVNVATPPKRSNASTAGDFINKINDKKSAESGMQFSNSLVNSKLPTRKRVSLEQGMSNIDTTPIKQYKSGGRATYKSGGAAKRGISPILLKGKR